MLWVCASIYLAGLVPLALWNRDKLLFALLWPIALPARVVVFLAMLIIVGFDSMN